MRLFDESEVDRVPISGWDVPACDPHYALLRSVAADVPCALWKGRTNEKGYARRTATRGSSLLHKAVYEAEVGPVPPGHQLDHLCRRRHCLEVAHLQVVTPRENVRRGNGPAGTAARKTTCDLGHPLTLDTRGKRRCLPCQKAQQSEKRRQKVLSEGRSPRKGRGRIPLIGPKISDLGTTDQRLYYLNRMTAAERAAWHSRDAERVRTRRAEAAIAAGRVPGRRGPAPSPLSKAERSRQRRAQAAIAAGRVPGRRGRPPKNA